MTNRNIIAVTLEQTSEREGITKIVVAGEWNGHKCFEETFESKEKPIKIHWVKDAELANTDASQSYSVTCLLKIMEDIILSKKISGGRPSETKKQMIFDFLDLNIIKQFERVAGISFDYSKFKTLSGFQRYFKNLLK